MRPLPRLLRDDSAASLAEFALVLPLFLLLLLGTIDVGRWMWNTGQAEKATQMGTRYAVVTDMIPTDLYNYSFAISGGVPQGTAVPASSFPGVSCTSNGTVATCVCFTGGTCAFGMTANQTAFSNIVTRMNEIYAGIGPANVRVTYSWSGLGYAGDPEGSDVDPIVTVSLRNMPFRPLTLGTLGNLGLPGTSHSLTMEDGEGTHGN